MVELVEQLAFERAQADHERDQVVAALSKCFPAYLTKHPDDPTWDKDWMNIVVIDLPTGQASWHFQDCETYLFTHLRYQENHWDGHTTAAKYERLQNLKVISFNKINSCEDCKYRKDKFITQKYCKKCCNYYNSQWCKAP